ncbi:MAG TPA: methyltransferase domain-containing protein [Nitrososphaera sp.]|nr:methyltransferase domain-containing protein [Nitrososphaera sp.]
MDHSPADFQRLWNYSTGFYAVWIAHIGRQTGLFAQLANSPATVDGLATVTGLYRPAVQAWCSASYAYGFVSKRNGKLYLTRNMRAMLLDKKNPKYLGGQFSYLALRSLEYDGFDGLFKHGKTRDMISTFDAIQQATDWDHYAFIVAIKRKRKELHLLLSVGCRLLDIGCGTGSFLAKLHKEYPKSSLVGIDPSDEAVKRAARIVKGRSVVIMKQDGENMRFSDEFDVVYLGESLYAMRDKQKVVSNCYCALKKGGIVAIIEGLLSHKQTSENRLILGMQLDFALQGYQFMTAKEVTKLLQTAGFSKIKYVNLGGSVYLVTARK